MPQQYTDCQCFAGQAFDGFCKEDCGNNFLIYALMLCMASVLGHLARIGNSIVSFRYLSNYLTCIKF